MKTASLELTRLVSAIVVMVGVVFAPAAAQAQTGTFSCRASAIKGPIIGEPVVANPQYTPCRTDEDSALSVRIPPSGSGPVIVEAHALRARTWENPFQNPDAMTGQQFLGGAAWASAGELRITALGLDLRAFLLSSTAGRKCIPGVTPTEPDIGGSSAIAFLFINGRPVPVSIPLRIPLLIGTLYTNYGAKQNGEVVTRAVWLDLAGDANDIIIAEAKGRSDGVDCPG